MQQQDPTFPSGGGGKSLGSHPLLGHVPDDSLLRATWQPASCGQAAMMAGGQGMPWCLRLQGSLQVDSLRAALLDTVRNEEALRTLLRRNPTTQRAEQLVLGPDQAERCLQFVQHVAGTLGEAMLVVEKWQEHRFSTQNGPAMRVDLVAVGGAAAGWRKRGAGSSADHHVLLVTVAAPHADRWSAAEHRRQVLAAYVAAVAGAPSPLPHHSLTYLDFSLWQRRCMEQQGRSRGEAQAARQRAAETSVAPALELPCDRPRPREPTYRSGAVEIRIPAGTVAAWKALLAVQGCTLFTGALALFHILLSRWTGQEEVATATVAANRGEHPALHALLGRFADEAVTVQSDLSGGPSYAAVLQRLRAKVTAAATAAGVPIGEAAAGCQAMFELQEGWWHALDVDTSGVGVTAEIVQLPPGPTSFDVHLALWEQPDGELGGYLFYSSDILDHDTALRMGRHFELLARSAVAQPDGAPFTMLRMLPDEELTLVTVEWNRTTPSLPFPPPTRLEAQVWEAARAHPQAVAVEEASGRSMTYAELAQRSADMAARLTQRGAGRCRPGDVVALAFGREAEAVVAALGVMSAGCVFMPIDVESTPPGAVQAMLADARPVALLAMDRYEERLKEAGATVPIVAWSAFAAAPPPAAAAAPKPPPSPSALAGLFYTSGSTGRPKGVMISHANLSNLVHWWARLAALAPGDKVLQFSSYSFIMSLRQIFPTLCTGAALVLPASPLEFGAAIAQCGVNKAALTPSALQTLDPSSVPTLKVVQVAGEAPTLALAKTWARHCDAFYIGLGPTELTAHACTGRFLPDDAGVNIGRPVSNAAAYVVNGEGQLQPVGVVGELWVAGPNVAQGYLNQAELTAASFTANPFDPDKPRLYRTGDLARWLPSGRVQFVGRRDLQVKIRGFRVEIGAIVDAILGSHPALRRAEVQLLGGEQLAAFVAPSVGPEVVAAVLAAVKRQLPAYMVPRRIIALPAFPLTKNGKLDRPALAAAAAAGGADGGGQSRSGSGQGLSTVESAVWAVWADLLGLGIDDLTPESNFFDLGGTSLSAILMTRSAGAAVGRPLPVSHSFAHQTLGQFCAALELGSPKAAAAAAPNGTMAIDIDLPDAARAMRVQGSPLPRPIFTALQLLGVSLVMAAGLGPAGGAIALSLWLVLGAIGWAALPLLPLVWLAATAAHLGAALAVKHCALGGRLRPGEYALFSPRFLQWWLQRRLLSVTRTWLWYLNQTPFAVGAYRLLGARIGAGVTLDDALVEDPDLVTIGELSVLQPFSGAVPGEVLGEALVLRRVQIGPRCRLQPRSCVFGGGAVAAGCTLRPASAVTAGSAPAPEGSVLEGAPAVAVGALPSAGPEWRAAYCRTAGFAAAQLAGAYFLVGVNVAGFGVTMAIAQTIGTLHGGFAAGVYCVLAFFLPLFLVVILLTVAAKWALVGRIRPGHRSGAWFALRMWALDRLLMSPVLRAATYVWLQEGTLFPLYLRALGATVGPHAWWNRVWVRTGVDCLSVGHSLHAGQMGLVMAGEEDGAGVDFRAVAIGDRCTLAQRVVLMPGSTLGGGVIVGAEGAVYGGMAVAEGGTVFGTPPTTFASTASDELHVRQLQRQVGSFLRRDDRRNTRRAARSASAASRARTPALMLLAAALANPAVCPALAAVFGGFYLLIVHLPLQEVVASSPGWLALLLPAVYMAGTAAVALALAAAARAGVASFRAGSTPFYSWRFFAWWLFAWVNDLCSWLLMYPVAGTWVYSAWLRLVGASVGGGAFVAPAGGGFREIDHLAIGGGGAVVLTNNLQGHFIDHNALQFAPCSVGDGGRVNAGATLMPLSSLGAGSTMRGLATTVKGQVLEAEEVFLGSPAAADASGDGR